MLKHQLLDQNTVPTGNEVKSEIVKSHPDSELIGLVIKKQKFQLTSKIKALLEPVKTLGKTKDSDRREEANHSKNEL